MGRKVAGCVPLRKREGTEEQEVLLVMSRWVEGVWLFPKGGVEEGEKPKMSAIRETREEAGVIGRIGPKLGSFKSSKHKETHKMYVLFVDEEFGDKDKRWKERGKRQRQWFTIPEATKVLTDLDEEKLRPELDEMLQKAIKKVKKYEESNGKEADDGSDDDGD